MPEVKDHPERYALANELHARPFPALEAPGQAVFLAIKEPHEAARRDRDADRAHLIALLDRFGAPHPAPGATHYFGPIGAHHLKWEQHTEFVTYTVFREGDFERPFDPAAFEVFPADWMAEAPGARVTSALIRVEAGADGDHISRCLKDWFVPESLAVSRVLDGTAVLAADFRIDNAGHMRFAVFAAPGTSATRVGRIVQRLNEIETYKTMSMLGLARAREISARLGDIGRELSVLVGEMRGKAREAEETLDELLAISGDLEDLSAKSSFRFGATGAYEAIVNQRIEVLRETRFQGRQMFGEFMMRRFDPAMRTVKSVEGQLREMADRAIRAGDLLRTRVDVERSAQNQKLLESMDRRADLQLRLQRMVEGLSVVAISYYAVNLALYLLVPLGESAGISKAALGAILTPPVVLAAWILMRRLRRKIE